MNRTITFIPRAAMTFSRATSRSEEPMRASLFSRLLGALTIVLMMLTTATAWAIDVNYINENGEEQTAIGVTVLSDGSTTLGAGWYVVSGTDTDTKITIEGTVTLSGDVNIILADGATMNIGTSINRISGNGIDGDGTLTIYGQTKGTGALNVYTQEGQKHGISVYALTINGGKITAYNSGQGSYAIYAKDNVTINRGTVKATATGRDSKGIYVEGIYDEGIYDKGGNVTISGGNVTATGDCYGIWAKNSVTISGGNVNATYSSASNIGSTDGIYAEGTITLGWTDYTDCIYASSYKSGDDVVTINGFLTDGNLLSGTVSTEDVAGKTLRPAVAYIDKDGNTQYATDYILLTGSDEAVNLKGGWYVVSGNVEYSSSINIGDDVHLILADGASMNINSTYDGIHVVGEDKSLTIYGQTKGTGSLTATSASCYGIYVEAGSVTVNGGNVTANGNEKGIYVTNSGSFTINGGNVTADNSNGIFVDKTGSSVTVNGGNVTANNIFVNNGTINLAGGIVTASSYEGALTIADGWTYTDGTDIYGGTLTGSELSNLAGKKLRPAVAYLDAGGNTKYANDYTLLTGSETVSNNGTIDLAAGWYVVNSNITYTGTITLKGDVNLILCDGYTMNMGTSGKPISSHGIKLEDGGDQSLTIYGQTNGTGALSIYTANSNILKGIVAKAVTINGGNITVNAHGDWSTAISAGNGDITINGGNVNVTASGDTNGWGLYANHNVTINGGKVEASGTSSGIRTDNNKPINLGWTNVTDRILANRYSGTLALADGKKLTDGTTTYTTTSELAAGDIAGKALYPYIENLALTANLADGNYWTTFYCGHTGYKIDDGENAWAYTAEYDKTDPNAPQLTLHKLGKVIPKGTAVILVGEDNSISMTASTDAAENSVSNNLHGVDVKKLKSELDPSTEKSGKFYVMGKVNEVFGFFEYTGAYMPARKAYLLVNGGAAQAKELTMVFEEEDADGIRSLTPALSEGEGAIYNLAGQRLNTMQKGINIVNGKKVLK